jgi:hypothetical protein
MQRDALWNPTGYFSLILFDHVERLAGKIPGMFDKDDLN